MCGLHIVGEGVGLVGVDEGGELGLALGPEEFAVVVGQVLIPLPDGLAFALEDLEEGISGVEERARH